MWKLYLYLNRQDFVDSERFSHIFDLNVKFHSHISSVKPWTVKRCVNCYKNKWCQSWSDEI